MGIEGYMNKPKPTTRPTYAKPTSTKVTSSGTFRSYGPPTGTRLASGQLANQGFTQLLSSPSSKPDFWVTETGTLGDLGPTGWPPGGGGGRGGGGGGGGGGGLTPEQQRALLAAYQKMGNPSLYDVPNLDLPDYQAQAYGPRNTAAYDFARSEMGRQGNVARQGITNAYNPLMQLLQQQRNPMAGATWATSPQMQNAYGRLTNSQLPNQAASGVNADAQGADAAFSGLMALLGAQEERNMASRMREAQQDQTGALTGLENSLLGLGSQLSMADILDQARYDEGKRAWDRDEYRQGLDAQMQEAMANWQARNQAAQTNAGIQNDWNANRFASIMDLIPMISDPGVLALLGA